MTPTEILNSIGSSIGVPTLGTQIFGAGSGSPSGTAASAPNGTIANQFDAAAAANAFQFTTQDAYVCGLIAFLIILAAIPETSTGALWFGALLLLIVWTPVISGNYTPGSTRTTGSNILSGGPISSNSGIPQGAIS